MISRTTARIPDQLALLPSYDTFLDAIDQALTKCRRVMSPGGRPCRNAGNVLRSRKRHETHHAPPLHANVPTHRHLLDEACTLAA